ncbi:MAG TPA: sigma-70 family RNA polymerase sigma factor [Blastocatellia bacterium]|jgi:RNA polymerase sigma factor (sigma-70 family)|nr:sigma-70 family RNA polymerase sigma factor [Blastocatellia bacterium]
MQRPSNFAERDDSGLIAACLRGEASAWQTLVVRYQRLIYSIPLKARLSQDDAADIFQSVCLKLYEKLSTLREHDKITSWLITTTTRECWRMAARRRRETAAVSNSNDDSEGSYEIPDPRLLADEQRQALEEQQSVRDAVGALPERCKELVTMLFYKKDELSYADIARKLDMPVASIGPTRARCLEKLKKLLEGRI